MSLLKMPLDREARSVGEQSLASTKEENIQDDLPPPDLMEYIQKAQQYNAENPSPTFEDCVEMLKPKPLRPRRPNESEEINDILLGMFPESPKSRSSQSTDLGGSDDEEESADLKLHMFEVEEEEDDDDESSAAEKQLTTDVSVEVNNHLQSAHQPEKVDSPGNIEHPELNRPHRDDNPLEENKFAGDNLSEGIIYLPDESVTVNLPDHTQASEQLNMPHIEQQLENKFDDESLLEKMAPSPTKPKMIAIKYSFTVPLLTKGKKTEPNTALLRKKKSPPEYFFRGPLLLDDIPQLKSDGKSKQAHSESLGNTDEKPLAKCEEICEGGVNHKAEDRLEAASVSHESNVKKKTLPARKRKLSNEKADEKPHLKCEEVCEDNINHQAEDRLGTSSISHEPNVNKNAPSGRKRRLSYGKTDEKPLVKCEEVCESNISDQGENRLGTSSVSQETNTKKKILPPRKRKVSYNSHHSRRNINFLNDSNSSSNLSNNIKQCTVLLERYKYSSLCNHAEQRDKTAEPKGSVKPCKVVLEKIKVTTPRLR